MLQCLTGARNRGTAPAAVTIAHSSLGEHRCLGPSRGVTRPRRAHGPAWAPAYTRGGRKQAATEAPRAQHPKGGNECTMRAHSGGRRWPRGEYASQGQVASKVAGRQTAENRSAGNTAEVLPLWCALAPVGRQAFSTSLPAAPTGGASQHHSQAPRALAHARSTPPARRAFLRPTWT